MMPREIETAELGFLWACRRAGVSPRHGSARREVARGLFVDVSQMPGRRPWRYGLRRATRNSKFYSYEHDRLITAEEVFKMYGWRAPRLEGLSHGKALDLLGDSMALPTLAVAAYALVLSAGDVMPGLFARAM